jgi:hypothetical protein
MSSQEAPKKVQDVHPAPVVSSDPTSQEAILARNAKTVQLQADSDSTFDTVLERFSDSSSRDGMPLFAVGLTLFSLGLLVFLSRKKK